MTTKSPLNTLLNALTMVHAREYAAQTDKLIWIETTLLDPVDIPRWYAKTVERVLADKLCRRCWMAPKWDTTHEEYVVRCYRLLPTGELRRHTGGDYNCDDADDARNTFNAMMDEEAARWA